MATANIPPAGGLYKAEKRRQNRTREMFSPDPSERWRLKNERISASLEDMGTAYSEQAKKNGKAFKQINSNKE